MGVEKVETTNSMCERVCEFVGTLVQMSTVVLFLNEHGTFLFFFFVNLALELI